MKNVSSLAKNFRKKISTRWLNQIFYRFSGRLRALMTFFAVFVSRIEYLPLKDLKIQAFRHNLWFILLTPAINWETYQMEIP